MAKNSVISDIDVGGFDAEQGGYITCVPVSAALLSGDLVGLVVKASASRAENPGFDSRFRRDLSWTSHTSDLETGTQVTTLPSTW